MRATARPSTSCRAAHAAYMHDEAYWRSASRAPRHIADRCARVGGAQRRCLHCADLTRGPGTRCAGWCWRRRTSSSEYGSRVSRAATRAFESTISCSPGPVSPRRETHVPRLEPTSGSPRSSRWNIEASLPGICCPVLASGGGRRVRHDGTARGDRAQVTVRASWLKLAGCGHTPHPRAARRHAGRGDSALSFSSGAIVPHLTSWKLQCHSGTSSYTFCLSTRSDSRHGPSSPPAAAGCWPSVLAATRKRTRPRCLRWCPYEPSIVGGPGLTAMLRTSTVTFPAPHRAVRCGVVAVALGAAKSPRASAHAVTRFVAATSLRCR